MELPILDLNCQKSYPACYKSITATNNSALMVDGVVEGQPTKMLIDSGSAVTILHEDVWKAACAKSCSFGHS